MGCKKFDAYMDTYRRTGQDPKGLAKGKGNKGQYQKGFGQKGAKGYMHSGWNGYSQNWGKGGWQGNWSGKGKGFKGKGKGMYGLEEHDQTWYPPWDGQSPWDNGQQ